MRTKARRLLCCLTLALLASQAGASDPSDFRWPTLDEQLAVAKARPRSAFEVLIAANQDFSLLRPEELRDTIGIPPWLRVLWRRAHPEGTYSADDPSGGYPLVLRNAYQWMQAHQDLVPGPGMGALDEGALELIESASVSGETRISGLQTTPRSSSDIRVNFWDPTKIIAAANNISGGGTQAQFRSTNTGASWAQSTLALQPGDAFHSGPTVDWTSDGTAWTTTIGVDAGVTTLKLRAYKSVDNGASWTFDNTVSAAQAGVDKQMMWTDHSNTSPFKDTIHVCWHNGSQGFVNRRTGPAGSWQSPILTTGAETTGTPLGCDVKTNAFGDVFNFWPATGSRRIVVAKSTSGGVSYGAGVVVANTFDSVDIGVPAASSRRPLIYVSGAAFRNASKNLVYATWTDLNGVGVCTSAANEPTINPTCKTRIWFSRSTNGGTTWSTPAMVDNDAAVNDQFNQSLTVDETTGGLSVVYYETGVGDPGRKKTDLWYQSSFDDGATWSTPTKVTSAQTDETTGGQDVGNQYGDYNGLSGYAGIFWPSWTDRRSALREEIWTAKVTDILCTPPGAPAIGTATATAPNQVQVTWGNGAPPSSSFNVYRAIGTCASPGTFAVVGNGVAGSPFNDGGVSGATTYAYKVTGRDATGNCESVASACVQATATGSCTLPPTFAGLASATNNGSALCGVTLAWSAATPACSGPVTYSVYRSTTSGFAPGSGSLLASGLTGTGYVDTTALVSGTTYHYVVRATDSSNGATETNSVQRSATVTGATSTGTLTETFEGALSGGGFDNAGWSHSLLTGTLDWAWDATQSQTPTHSWASNEGATAGDRVLVSPSFVPQGGSTLSFWHTFAFETNGSDCFDGGTLEVSTDGGGIWSVVPDGNFTAGLFNGTVDNTFANPIGGKRAWCQGTVGAMTQVTVDLASFMPATDVKLRWHEGDDVSDTAAEPNGWFVDSVTLSGVGLAGACVPSEIFANGFETGTLVPWTGGFTPP